MIGSPHTTAAPLFTFGNSPAPTINTLSTSRTDWNVQAISSEFADVDSRDYQTEIPKNAPGFLFIESKYHGSGSSLLSNIIDSIGSTYAVDDSKFNIGQPHVADFTTDKLTDVDIRAIAVSSEEGIQVPQEHDLKLINPLFQNEFSPNMITSCFLQDGYQSKDSGADNDRSGKLKKLDSWRWMDKEIGRDCGDSLMASDSGHYWNALDAGTDDKEVSSLSRFMLLDMDSLGPSLSWEQLFSIRDFSPDWAYSGVETKVLIAGEFLGNKILSSSTKWGCMFGEIEVPAEVLTNNVIRCQAPLHSPGCVPFYVTCSNRLACSEVREFVYREKPPGISLSTAVNSTSEEEESLQIRLAKLLMIGSNRKWLDCSSLGCEKCKLKDTIYSMGTSGYWDCKDDLIHNLLRHTLCDWLLCKLHEHSKALHVLDEQGQGVIHLAAALGYDWALGPMVTAGFNPNFRDIRGRTALHWASQFGREKTVLKLIKLGVAPGAVDDPTTEFPGGRTAADLASSRGHKGIAGYLAEAHLTAHLSSLSCNNNETDNAVAITTDDDVDAAAQFLSSDGLADDQCSLRGSLAAIRNSENAAALIQAAFRARSFKDRQLTRISSESNDVFEVPLDAGALSSLNKGLRTSNLHTYAVRIQKRYRGWKRRNDFLQKRNNIIKIQAHVRGHQVRKQYKKVLWSVGIVEKAILRWRRKGAGLRGFRAKPSLENVEAVSEKSDEYEYLRIGRKQKITGVEKALARVKSMAGDPKGRDQYMRLVREFEELEVGDKGQVDTSMVKTQESP